MNIHDYTPQQALDALMKQLRARDNLLASRVQAVVDAGKDISETEPAIDRRKKPRIYRKTVPFSHEEALQAAIDAFQAYFLEQPLFANSAADNFHKAAIGVSTGFELNRVDVFRLSKTLMNEKKDVRLRALRELPMYLPREDYPEAISELLHFTQDPDVEVRKTALETIEQIGMVSRGTVLHRLSEMIEHDIDSAVRAVAKRMLAASFRSEETPRAPTQAESSEIVSEEKQRTSRAQASRRADVVSRIDQDEEKQIEIELQTETQVTRTGAEFLLLKRVPQEQITEQSRNIAWLRELTKFGEG